MPNIGEGGDVRPTPPQARILSTKEPDDLKPPTGMGGPPTALSTPISPFDPNSIQSVPTSKPDIAITKNSGEGTLSAAREAVKGNKFVTLDTKMMVNGSLENRTIELQEVLGSGTLGTVFKGKVAGTNQVVAIKMVELSENDEQGAIEKMKFKNELSNLALFTRLRHETGQGPNTPDLLGQSHGLDEDLGQVMWVVTDLYDCDAEKYQKHPSYKALSDDDKENFKFVLLKKMTDIVANFHDPVQFGNTPVWSQTGAVMQDIKPENFLIKFNPDFNPETDPLDKMCTVVFGDNDTIFPADQIKIATASLLTASPNFVRGMNPEAPTSSYVTKPNDLYSLACSLYQVAFQKNIYEWDPTVSDDTKKSISGGC